MIIKKFNAINENISENFPLFTKLNRADVSVFGNISKHEDNVTEDIYVRDCGIHWNCDIQKTRGGIEGISVSIGKIVLNVMIDVYNNPDVEDDFEQLEETLEFNVENSTIIIDDKHSIDSGDYERQTLPYFPSEIEISRKEDGIIIEIKF